MTSSQFHGQYSDNNDSMQPLFERMETDEYLEAQRNREVIESLQQRLEDLERINMDLEYRLEDQARLCMDLEHECTEIDRHWKERCEIIEKDTEVWRNKFLIEEKKGDRLREQISRTEKEMYGILQRKYELMRGPGAGGRGLPERRQTRPMDMLVGDISGEGKGNVPSSSTGGEKKDSNERSSQDARQRKAISNLADFFGV